MNLDKIKESLSSFFSDEENPLEAGYDPVHVGAMIVLTLLGISLTFWLLWALMVFGGGLQAKILPFIVVIFTSKTAGDFGYIGYPYEMGVFEGWPTNLAAVFILLGVITAGWFLFNKKSNKVKGN